MANACKRILDVFVAVVLGTVMMPLMLVLALFIRGDSPGPAIFRQVRIGQYGRPFTILKFRTMRLGAQMDWHPPTEFSALNHYFFQDGEDPRITRFGAWLRKTSLDELPNLWNVLIGDMSLVGPRPEVPEIVSLYDEMMWQRLEVKPGITGMAQVHGRGELSTRDAIQYDLEYCQKWTLGLDLRILWKTVGQVMHGHGAR